MDPVFKIRIRVTQKRPEPSGSGSGSYFDMFLKFSKEHFLRLFYTKYKHLMTLKGGRKKTQLFTDMSVNGLTPSFTDISEKVGVTFRV